MNVQQVLSGAGPHDAVTAQAFAYRERFDAWGWGGREHAVSIDPRVASRVAPLRALGRAGLDSNDLLLIHYSAYAPKLRRVLELANRKVLISHNVTPARWFWDYEPTIAIHCALGRKELPAFAEACDVVAGVSAFNAGELGSDVVVPILFDPDRLARVPHPAGSDPLARPAVTDSAASGSDPTRAPTLLFVGRLAPHKRQDELIRVVALLRSSGRLPDARLVLVGEPLNANYDHALRELADRLAPGAVEIVSSLSTDALAARYAEASVFLCLSEHEGFCIPLLEAFAAGVPVVARAEGAVPETAGDAALLVDDRDLAVVAELVALAVEDEALRAELMARGRRRLEAYAPDRTAQTLRAVLEGC